MFDGFAGALVISFLFYSLFREAFTKMDVQPTFGAMVSGSGFITGIITMILTIFLMFLGKDD